MTKPTNPIDLKALKQAAEKSVEEYQHIIQKSFNDQYPRAILRLLRVIAEYERALDFYTGNFDGREGTRWNRDHLFFIETKFGSTEPAYAGTMAREALANGRKILEGAE